MKIRLACIVSLFFLLLMSGNVYPQLTYDGCIDKYGRAVLSIQSAIPNVAAATVLPDGRPVIYYNPMVLSWFAPKTRLFWYAHECAHHVLGHTLGNVGLKLPVVVEMEADCWGIRELLKRKLVTNNDVNVIASDMLKTGPGDWSHLPGPIRAVKLVDCTQDEEERGSPVASGSHGTLKTSTKSPATAENEPFKFFTEAARTSFQELKGQKVYVPGAGRSWDSTVSFPDATATDIWPSGSDGPSTLSARFSKISSRKQALELFNELKDRMRAELGDNWNYETKNTSSNIYVAAFEARKKGSMLRVNLHCQDLPSGYKITIRFYGAK